MVRLETLGDDDLARELGELLVLTGIAEVPDETGTPPGLPSGRRNEPPEMTPELALRVGRAAEELGSRIGAMRDDLLSLELARRALFDLIEHREPGRESTDERDPPPAGYRPEAPRRGPSIVGTVSPAKTIKRYQGHYSSVIGSSQRQS